MNNYRKLIANVLGAVASGVISGGDWRIIVAGGLSSAAVWFFPNGQSS